MIKNIILILFLIFVCQLKLRSEIIYLNEFQLKSSKNFIHDFKALNDDRTYNAIVEIPAGSNEKWEVSKDGLKIELQFKNGLPRIIDYLPYPINYGFIPRTNLPVSVGGDGDALDVLILGPSIERGSKVKIKVIGMLEMLDNGEIDNKIVGAVNKTKISRVKSIKQLQTQYPGVLDIIKIWFNNYKGVNMEIKGYANKKKAKKFIEQTILFYENK